MLVAETWGKLSAIHKDPVEKKPLYHFYPGSSVLSIGSVGCNMKCRCCQNWQISQVSAGEYNFDREYEPREIVSLAVNDPENIGVAYTYNEPGMWFEFMLATARIIHDSGLKNIVVSNGFISDEPLGDLLPVIDAFNIDLKGFNREFYRTFTGSAIEPVLNSLKKIRLSGSHLEITCLIVPGLNDNRDEFAAMVSWIADELGPATVLHLSRYHPAYKMGIDSTPANTLEDLFGLAQKKLNYLYAGNIRIKDFQDTKCHNCHNVVIKRVGYYTDRIAVTGEGLCKHCGTKVIVC